MKVSDLMDDLETGDRSSEHLTKPAEPERSLFEMAREQLGQLGGVIGGFTGISQATNNHLAQWQQRHMDYQMLANQHAMQNTGGLGMHGAQSVGINSITTV